MSKRKHVPKNITRGQAQQAADLINEFGGIRRAARSSKCPWVYSGLQARYKEAVRLGLIEPLDRRASYRQQAKDEVVEEKPVIRGRVKAIKTASMDLPAAGKIKRYLLTCAQNNTHLHDDTWRNLLALAKHYDAEIMVSRFTYDKRLHKPSEKITARHDDINRYDEYHYDKRIIPYLSDDRIELAEGLVWCGEMNILPTAVNPLSGLEVYTGRRSMVVPHVKIALQSIPSGKYEATKFNYTTGTVTQRNYIQKKAGLKAEFHHCYGALLVEVDDQGRWFCRQLNADSEGTLYDLKLRVMGGQVEVGDWVVAINMGDIHEDEMDETVKHLTWGPGGMLDTLRPQYQIFHDILSMRARTHWEMRDPHVMFKKWVWGREDVRSEVLGVINFLHETERPWCRTKLVSSNHDRQLARWLKEEDARKDPVNAEFYFRVQAEVYAEIRRGRDPNYLLSGIIAAGGVPGPNVDFLHEDESFIICEDANGGIECGMHGDLGPNGARGTANNLAKMGRKANVGHTHSAGIVDGIYTAGTCGALDPDWVKGPSSWSHSHIVTYENGKRAIVTMWQKKWRA